MKNKLSPTLLCRCHKVSFEKLSHHHDQDAFQSETKGGTRCGSCLPTIKSYYDFNEVSLREKYHALDLLVTEHLRPTLQNDGGDMVIEHIEETKVWVSYVGTCQTCPSSTKETLDLLTLKIQNEYPFMNVMIMADE
jgi:Fe-S cluster biogenesis protein NfuA